VCFAFNYFSIKQSDAPIFLEGHFRFFSRVNATPQENCWAGGRNAFQPALAGGFRGSQFLFRPGPAGNSPVIFCSACANPLAPMWNRPTSALAVGALEKFQKH